MNTSATTLRVSEVGPRDGLQSISCTLSTGGKCRWISALQAAVTA